MHTLIAFVIFILIVCFIAGVLRYIVMTAPFFIEPFRSWLSWGIIVVALLVICLRLWPLAEVYM